MAAIGPYQKVYLSLNYFYLDKKSSKYIFIIFIIVFVYFFFFRIPQWSSDEKICARFLNGEVLFYENSNFDNIVHRIKGLKLNNYSISPGNQPLNVLCFLPGIFIHSLIYFLL